MRRYGRCMTQPILVTERPGLVPLTDEHLEFEVELDSDPGVMRQIAGHVRVRADVTHARSRRLVSAHHGGQWCLRAVPSVQAR
jgi:hypothetical protein